MEANQSHLSMRMEVNVTIPGPSGATPELAGFFIGIAIRRPDR